MCNREFANCSKEQTEFLTFHAIMMHSIQVYLIYFLTTKLMNSKTYPLLLKKYFV